MQLEATEGAYFTVEKPTNIVGQRYIFENRSDREFWSQFTTDIINITVTAEELASQCGATAKSLAGKLCAYAMLNHLPLLKAWVEEKNLFDARRLQAISDTLCEAKAKIGINLDDFDAALVKALQPIRKDQFLPTPGEIKKKVKKLLFKMYGLQLKKKEKEHKDSLDFWQNSEVAETLMVVSFDEAMGTEIEARILECARQWGVSPVEALKKIILTKVKMKITLNTYGADGKAEYADHIGDLTPELSEYFTDKATVVHDMDEAKNKVSTGYKPSGMIRDFVRGRDGTCCFPGCNVPALYCEIDHVQDYKGGGPTSPDNLHLMCHRHHTLKTLGLVQVIMDNLGVNTWFFSDGERTTTFPTGPLAGLASKMGLRNSFTSRREWLFEKTS
ncbi:HNH endonuclease signature motif containing protein [uncultured Corynebacterium sp.]|uniref:HNH endonuclease signature motif containing protein n=1 Tax=uncultured Corynebacterium sp. TaxID=159447 RepID=UPI00261C9AC7|nr:HNH endonuclease signature motif containing protein [uncultured Corynebacterium sp.]